MDSESLIKNGLKHDGHVHRYEFCIQLFLAAYAQSFTSRLVLFLVSAIVTSFFFKSKNVSLPWAYLDLKLLHKLIKGFVVYWATLDLYLHCYGAYTLFLVSVETV